MLHIEASLLFHTNNISVSSAPYRILQLLELVYISPELYKTMMAMMSCLIRRALLARF